MPIHLYPDDLGHLLRYPNFNCAYEIQNDFL